MPVLKWGNRSIRMRSAAIVFTLLLSSLSLAQTSLDALRDRLVNKPLFLAGQWRDNHLAFDPAGKLYGKSDPVSFTLAGFDVKSVDRKGDKLVLKGRRAGLEFPGGTLKRVPLHDSIILTIDAPTDDDFGPALKLIFISNLQELAPKLPSYWQPFVQAHLLPPSGAAIHTLVPSGVVNASKEIDYPVLIHQVEPQVSSASREMGYSGEVIVEFEVDEAGKPQHLFLLTPAGLGLDECALGAVSQYVFRPALHKGQAVPVVMDVSVNFQTF